MKIFVYCASYKVHYIDRLNWTERSKFKLDFSAGPGIAVREFQTDVGPAELRWGSNQEPLPFADITGQSDALCRH